MSNTYKLNKSELSRLKRQLKSYEQYLPVMRLKQEKLQFEQNRINKALSALQEKENQITKDMSSYVKYFPLPYGPDVTSLVTVKAINTEQKNIVGISFKSLVGIELEVAHIKYFQSMPWVIRVIPILKDYLDILTRLSFIKKESLIINKELKKAIQKVNLFEKVLIKQTKIGIKKIKLALDEEQIAMVSRGKIAKRKILPPPTNLQSLSQKNALFGNGKAIKGL